jgi:hypothetical protein
MAKRLMYSNHMPGRLHIIGHGMPYKKMRAEDYKLLWKA